LVAVLKAVLRGWNVREVADSKAPPKIRMSLGPRGYERRSPWLDAGTAVALHDPVDAVCDLLLDIERAYVEDAPARGEGPRPVLHAAAVEMGSGDHKGLVLFPSTHATGKSLLTVALAHAGHRVFADDQVPIQSGKRTEGLAPGVLVRVRRPLPDGLDAELADYVRTQAGPESARFRYVNLGNAGLASLGSRAPVNGIVLLERADGAKPAITVAPEAEVPKACVLQNFGRKQNALQILDTLHAMVQGAKCVKLTYTDAPQAVALLEEAFA